MIIAAAAATSTRRSRSSAAGNEKWLGGGSWKGREQETRRPFLLLPVSRGCDLVDSDIVIAPGDGKSNDPLFPLKELTCREGR